MHAMIYCRLQAAWDISHQNIDRESNFVLWKADIGRNTRFTEQRYVARRGAAALWCDVIVGRLQGHLKSMQVTRNIVTRKQLREVRVERGYVGFSSRQYERPLYLPSCQHVGYFQKRIGVSYLPMHESDECNNSKHIYPQETFSLSKTAGFYGTFTRVLRTEAVVFYRVVIYFNLSGSCSILDVY
jgi:hypothetical protein